MAYQNVSYVLAPADAEAVFTALNLIQEKLPFLIALTADERKALVKRGPKSADFVRDAQHIVESFSQILPPAFAREEFLKDAELFAVLDKMVVLMSSLCEKVEHTHMAVGSEAMKASLETYSYAQTAAERTPGLNVVVDRMFDRFKKSTRNKTEPPK